MTRDDINNALNLLTDLTVDYGKRDADGIKELDDALDVVQMAAQAYEHIGADAYKTREQDARNKEYARGFAESREAVESILADQGVLYQITNADFRDADTITLQPKKGDPVEYWKAKRGYWEPVDEPPRIMPMLVCSECQKTNFYPGAFCTYCGSYNEGGEE